MVTIPKRTLTRIKGNLTKFKRILKKAQQQDINESQTVVIITDMLQEIMGYDKYTEVSHEYEIAGGYCDLGIKIEDKLHLLIEVKAIGLTLKENHLRQAINYASRHGSEWVILTNGIMWEVHRVIFQQPIKTEEIFTLNLLEIGAKDTKAIEQIFSISREGILKLALEGFRQERQLTNRYALGLILQSEPILKVLNREIRKINKSVKVTEEELLEILRTNVFKREVIEGDRADEVAKLLRRKVKIYKKKATRKPKQKKVETTITVPPPPPPI